jgi:arginine/lysine/ornithine decarboxylase
MSPRKAMLAVGELTPIENAVGKVLADPSVSCPPAVPILVSGERIDQDAANCFAYYGISKCRTVKE